jgi:hypothetical protein
MPTTLTMAMSRSSEGINTFFDYDEHVFIPGLDVSNWLDAFSFPYKPNGIDCCECPICLEILSHEDKVSVFACKHVMHHACSKTWISSCILSGQPATCPLCNFVILCPVFQMTQVEENIHESRTRSIFRHCVNFVCGKWFSRR